MPPKINLLNQRFGRLVVIEETKERKSGSVVWKCQCDCGNTYYTTSKSLRSGKCNSCGCLHKDNVAFHDITGQRFGRLIVLEPTKERRSNSVVWKCQCDCGNITYKDSHSLIKGSSKSCGCLLKDVMHEIGEAKLAKDISGQKFGKLTAIKRLSKQSPHQTYYWLCECECGNTTQVLITALTSGRTTSCGCVKSSTGENYIKNILLQENIDFIREYKFPDLVSDKNRCLKFDFYLPAYNILIEFDGEQHYKWNRYSSLNSFKRDCQKNEYSLIHQIPLYRIPYEDLNLLPNYNFKDLIQKKYLVKEKDHYHMFN